jgi:hypothetical protein
VPGGQTITDLLPGGVLLENPFAKTVTEPIDGVAGASGQTGYAPIIQGGVNVGYSITGFGKAALVLTLTSGS